MHSLCKFLHTNYPTLSSSFCLSGSSSSLLYHLPPSVFQTKPHRPASSSLSPLQDGGGESHIFGPEVNRCWIWRAAISDLLQWLLSPCLSAPISAAFLHSWEMCLLAPHAVRCGLLPAAWAPSRTHTRSQCLPPFEAELNYMLSGEMEERLMKRRRNVSSLAVLYKALKGNWKTRA